MGGKLLFLFMFLVCLVIVGGLFAYNLNLLPQTAYPVIFRFESYIPFIPKPAPYLEKFQGGWAVSLQPNSADEASSICVPATGTMSIENGVIYGDIPMSGEFVALNGKVSGNGTFTGYVGVSTQTASGPLSGQIEGTVGTGTWEDDALSCSGQLTFTKFAPVVDPAVGEVVSVNGYVSINRADGSTPATVNESVYAGDVITAAPGSGALLSIGPGSASVTINSASSYTVPNDVSYSQ